MIYTKALAVSGGKDSMAMVHAFKKESGIVALTVDHKLRSDSTSEALMVQKWVTDLGIPHVILTWEHEGVSMDIQNKARLARYDLMTKWCLGHGVLELLVAHHREDQLETFFMRLSKGSGIKGLGVMKPSTFHNGVEIKRPFLTLSSKQLHEHILDDRFVDDPSNHNPKFARTHFRALVEKYLRLDEDAHILKSIDKLTEADQYLDELAEQHMDHDLRSLPYVIFERVINKMFAGEGYPYKSQKVKQLYETLRQPDFRTTTFGHHLFKKEKDQLVVIKEKKQ